MKAQEFISLAGRLAAAKPDAASCRTAISRANYGAYHAACELLTSVGTTVPRTENAHIFVQHPLYNCGIEELRLAAAYLSDLHSDRLKADYQLANSEVEQVELAREGVANATRISAAVDTCQTPELLQQFKDGIAAYERRIRN